MKEITSRVPPMTTKDYKAEIARMFQQLERSHQEMQESQKRIEAMREESRRHAENTRRILDEIAASRTK